MAALLDDVDCFVFLIPAFPVPPRYTIYMSVAADFPAVVEKNPWLFYISAKSLENFSEFFKFSESSADNAHFLPQRVGEIVHSERFEVVNLTR